jgi:cell division protease FtsH
VPYAGFVGDMRISYAKFLALLERHRIKRLIIYGDMRTAIVEVTMFELFVIMLLDLCSLAM